METTTIRITDTKERWSRWLPLNNLAKNYYLDSISDDIQELKFVLSEANNEKRKLHITFDNSVYSYRTNYETFRLKLIYNLDKLYGSEFFINWPLFKIHNSEYLQWFSKQSHGKIDSLPLTHFAILSVESFIDILAEREPKVELIEIS